MNDTAKAKLVRSIERRVVIGDAPLQIEFLILARAYHTSLLCL